MRQVSPIGVGRSVLFVIAVLMFGLPLAATVSHVRGDWLALYATPAYVAHARAAEFMEGAAAPGASASKSARAATCCR